MKLGVHQSKDKAEPKATLKAQRPFGLESQPGHRPTPVEPNAEMDRASRYGHSFSSLARTGSPRSEPAGPPIQLTKARDRYDASGREKWREYIDAKDHEAALKEVQDGLITHPGEYYDYLRGGDGRSKTGDHWKAFQRADAYVSQSIDDATPLDADEYLKIHMLAAGGYESNLKKGWRENEVTWGLRDPTQEKVGHLTRKGLTVEQGDDRTTVRVAAPQGRMRDQVQAVFEKYHKQKAEFPAASAMELYEELELLHPTKDASSRTNHLILNRLLAEYGLHPAVLNEPNTPEQSYEDVTANILGASRRGHEVAMSQDASSVEELHKSRAALSNEADEERMVEELMSSGRFRGMAVPRRAPAASSSSALTSSSAAADSSSSALTSFSAAASSSAAAPTLSLSSAPSPAAASSQPDNKQQVNKKKEDKLRAILFGKKPK